MCASAIDPVTGAPMLDQYIIDQIPLGSQVFPWQDVKPDQKPARQAIYPDDIIPTTAMLIAQAAEYPDAARTGYIDSNHRLLVQDQHSGSSGGGVSPQPYKDGFVGSFFGFKGSGANAQFLTSVSFSTAIYGLIGTLGIEDTTSAHPHGGNGGIWVAPSADHSKALYLAAFGFAVGFIDIAQQGSIPINFTPPIPIDVNATFGTGALDLLLDAAGGKFAVAVQLLGF